jgi:hypothetical protein
MLEPLRQAYDTALVQFQASHVTADDYAWAEGYLLSACSPPYSLEDWPQTQILIYAADKLREAERAEYQEMRRAAQRPDAITPVSAAHSR